ncbi:MAG: nitroreductase family protein [Salibacteraceae bacterium]
MKQSEPQMHVYNPVTFTPEESLRRSREFYEYASKRRSIRDFSEQPVEEEIILNLIRTAGTAPSGANKQPWTFCLISDPKLKKLIRNAAEKEEYESYNHRMPEQWLKDLEPLGTDWHKPFLEKAPWLIVVFKRIYEIEGKEKRPNYYVNESVGIACGMLIQAIHHAGLVTLTHTPSPMNFLGSILNRPENERPYLLMPVGYPAPGAKVPAIEKKSLESICVRYK